MCKTFFIILYVSRCDKHSNPSEIKLIRSVKSLEFALALRLIGPKGAFYTAILM